MTATNKPTYISTMTRRDSLKWMGLMAATVALPGLASCSSAVSEGQTAGHTVGHWPSLTLEPVTAGGYGKDPDLISPLSQPWARTLTPEQLTEVALLCDIIVPVDGKHPSATQVNVPDVIDEWVSAPYERQQRDRQSILPLLMWLNDEAGLREGNPFVLLSPAGQQAILNDIATLTGDTLGIFVRPAQAFARLRTLVLAGYFSSPAGSKDIGYMGNVAIAGDYPGPSDEALNHINQVISELGLSEYAYKG